MPGETIRASTYRFFAVFEPVRNVKSTINRLFRSSHGIILMYHRVADLRTDPWNLGVGVRNFDAQLSTLRKHMRVVPLHYFTDESKRAEMDHASVAITFDDGYEDNLSNALPLLEKYDLPATVFVTTGNIDNEQEFWWDALERIFMENPSLPDTLPEAMSELETICQQYCKLTRTPLSEADRKRLYLEAWNALHRLSSARRAEVIASLHAWSGVDSTSRDSHKTLSASQVRTLHASDLVTIGAHSVSHQPLSVVDGPQQREELCGSKRHLDTLLGCSTTEFAYPHGEYSDATLSLVRECGFALACTTEPRRVSRTTRPLALPRFAVQNWGEHEFLGQLRRWQR